MSPFLRLLLLFAVVALLKAGVDAAETDAQQTEATGAGLATATAGSAAFFTITAKDSSGSARQTGGDIFVVELSGASDIAVTPTDLLNGEHSVTYTPTVAGAYNVDVKYARRGGLKSEIYENVWFFYTPVNTQIDPEINHDWGTGLITDSAKDYVSIRWTGKVRPKHTGTHTFYLSSDDGAKLWVNNVLLIDRWDSFTDLTRGYIELQALTLYDIKVEYKEVTGPAFVKLYWSSASMPREIISSENFFYETHIGGGATSSPFTLQVDPSATCASTSTAEGNGISYCTAGTAVSFTINAKDAYGNDRGVGAVDGEIFVARISPPSQVLNPLTGSLQSSGVTRPQHATIVDNYDGTYVAEYSTTTSGVSALTISRATVGGLRATYFDSDDLTSPAYSATEETVSWTAVGTDPAAAMADTDDFSVAYKGLFMSEYSQTYTFYSTLGSSNEKARLWVDGRLVIDHWDTLSTNEPSGTVSLTQNVAYDVLLHYSDTTGTETLQLSYETSGVGTIAKAIIASDRLYTVDEIATSPRTIDVQPAGTSASQSFAVGNGLSEATAGKQSYFTIVARDLYGNYRTTGGEDFDVRLTGADSTAGVVSDGGDGTYAVVYTATKTGAYKIGVVYGATGVNGSPFSLDTSYAEGVGVRPGQTHGPACVTTGNGLSTATAGVAATFSITAKDRHDNNRNIAYDSFSVQLLDNDGDVHSFTGGSAPAITHAGSGIYTVTYVPDSALYGDDSFSLSVTFEDDGFDVKGSPFDLKVMPGVACASKSFAFGDQLSLATAGVAASFHIQSRDKDDNNRAVGGDSFVVRVRPDGERDVAAEVADNDDSLYTVTYTATRSGTSEVFASLAEVGGVHAYYFDTASFGTPAVENPVSEATIEWSSVSGATVTPEPFSVRYTGLFLADQADEYTFFVEIDSTADENFRLYIDNVAVMDFWTTSPAATSESGTITFPTADRLYDLLLEYKDTSGAESLVLKYEADGITKAVVPSTKLYYANSVGAHVATGLGNPYTLSVEPGIACSMTSVPFGAALSTYTVGATAEFTIQAKDAFGNLREVGGDDFRASLSSAADVTGVVSYSSAGLYDVSYNASVSGTYNLNVNLMQPGGLHATYFLNSDLTDAKKTRIDNTINFAWEDDAPLSGDEVAVCGGLIAKYYSDTDLTSLVTITTDSTIDFSGVGAASPPSAPTVSGNNFGARWSGFFKPTTAGEYTFYVELEDDEEISLYIEDTQVINGWGAFPGAEPSGTFEVPAANDYYRIRLDFREFAGDHHVGLKYEASGITKAVIPSARLCQHDDYFGADYFSVRWEGKVKPAYSEVFTFTAEIDDGVRLWVDNLLVVDQWYSIYSEVEGTIPLVAGTLYDIKMEYKEVVGNATAKLSWRSGSLEQQLIPSTALYFETSTGSSPYTLTAFPAVTSGDSSATDFDYATFTQSVAWGTALSTGTAGEAYTFEITAKDSFGNTRTTGGDSFMTVLEVVSINPPLDAAIGDNPRPVHGAITDNTDGTYEVAYTATVAGQYSMAPALAVVGGLDATYYDHLNFTVGTSKVDSQINGATWGQGPTGVGLTDGNTFAVRWQGLVESPAAEEVTFFFSVAGLDERVRLWVDEYPVIDAWTAISATVVSGTIAFSSGNDLHAIKVEYKEFSGDALAVLEWDSTTVGGQTTVPSTALYRRFPLNGTPLEYTLEPTTTCSSASTMWGVALSLATAGSASSIMITAKDAYTNNRQQGGDDIIVRAVPQLLRSGGLSAQYYEDADLESNPVAPTVDGTVDFSATANTAIGPLADGSSFSATWTGFVKPDYKEEYTFTVVTDGTDERVRLYVDGEAIIDQFASNPGGAVTGTYDFFRGGDEGSDYYSIFLEYTEDTNDHMIQLRYNSANQADGVIPSANLYYGGLCIGCSTIEAEVTDNEDDTYVASYTVTKSGDYDLVASLRSAGGLRADYYDSRTLAGNYIEGSSIETTVDWSGTPPAPVADADVFSVRYTGYYLPLEAAETTLFVEAADTNDRVRLFVDGSLIIDKWTVNDATKVSGTYAFADASALADIVLEYAEYGVDQKVILSHEASGTAEEVIPSTNLYNLRSYVTGSAYELTVNVAETCASTSKATGAGLTIATVASAATFYITAKDAFQNIRSQGGDSYVVRLQEDSALASRYSEDSTCCGYANVKVPNDDRGEYTVAYTVTQAGDYNINVLLPQSGGLLGQYYNNIWFINDPVVSRIDTEVDFVWPDLITPTGSDYIGVRWTGYVKANYTETHTIYTDTDDGVKLWWGNTLLIDQWSASAEEFSATVSLTEGFLYEIKMEYKEVTGTAYAKLKWSSTSIPKDAILRYNMFNSPRHISGSPFRSFVSPGTTCAATSSVDGAGLSVGTAGSTAEFIIQSKDAYHNKRSQDVDTYVVYARPNSDVPAAPSRIHPAATANARDKQLDVTYQDVNSGAYKGRYTPTKSGTTQVFADHVTQGGLRAVYYPSVDLSGTPATHLSDGIEATVDWSEVGTTSPPSSSVTGAAFSVVYEGFVEFGSVAEHTFHTYIDGTDERVRLWVDNDLLIDEWTAAASATQLSGTIQVATSGGLYHVRLEYADNTGDHRLSFSVETGGAETNPIGSGSLYYGYTVYDTPYTVDVQPAATCAAKTIAFGSTLSLATAGETSQFTIYAYDEYLNPRAVGGDEYFVHVIYQNADEDNQADPNHITPSPYVITQKDTHKHGEITDNGDGTYLVSYVPESKGSHKVVAYLGKDSVPQFLIQTYDGTPDFWSLDVQPGTTCGSKSFAVGDSLSLSTAGTASSFQIQARDSFGNHKESSLTDQFMVRLSGPESLNFRAEYAGSTDGLWDVSYQTTKSGTFNLDVNFVYGNGLLATYFRDEDLSESAVIKVDENIDFDWSFGTPHENITVVDDFSIRWAGFLLPGHNSGGVEEYTFFVEVAEPDDRFKLYVDNTLIMDQWTTAVPATRVSATHGLYHSVIYDLKLEYRDLKTAAGVTLKFESASVAFSTVSSSNLFYKTSPILGSPFSLAVEPGTTCASTSTGSPVTLATAGTATSFTIQAKDQLENSRTVGGDLFAVRAKPPNFGNALQIGTITDNEDGTYSATVTATKTGTNLLYATLLAQGGLRADYYNGLNFDTDVVHSNDGIDDQEVDFSSSTGAFTYATTNADDISIRYTGFGRTLSSGETTFYVDIAGTDERVRLFVNNDNIVDFWTTAPSATSMTATVDFGSTTAYYDITLEYSDDTGDHALTLSHAAGGSTKATIPTTHLYYGSETENSPHTLTVKSGLSCATNSYAYGSALTVTTAGVANEFSIQADDAYSNERDNGGSSFVVRGELTSYPNVHGSASYTSDGLYTGKYTLTVSGTYDLHVELGEETRDGLFGVYFSDENFAVPSRVRIDRNLDINWGLASPFDSGFASDYFSVRWTGFILANYTEVHTFYTLADDGVRLTLNDVVLIDKLNSPNEEFSATVSLTAGVLYDIKLEYKEKTGLAKLKLTFESGSMARTVPPPENLFPYSQDVFGSHFSTVVNPAAINGAKSVAFGGGISTSTAGVATSFSIQSKDVYHNDRDSGGHYIAVRLEAGDSSDTRPFLGQTTDNSDGTYTSTYTPTRAGSHSLFATLVGDNGLQATFYSDTTMTRSTSDADLTVDNVEWSTSGTTPPTGSGLSAGTSFSARYEGLFLPSVATEHTFYVGVAEVDERVRLFVDDTAVIDAWTTAPGATTVSGTISFPEATTDYYSLKLEYIEHSGNQELTLQYSFSGGAAATIPSTALFQSEHLRDSPFTVVIDPAETCASTSTTLGNGLSISTSGLASSFVIAAQDAYYNSRNSGGDVIVVRAIPSHEVSVGGLTATYYEEEAFTSAAGTAVSDLDFSTTSGTVPPSSGLASDDTFSAVYAGYFLPPVTTTLTFRATVNDGTDEGVKLWVDNKLVVDMWTTTTSTATGTYSFGLVDAYYDILVHYKEAGTTTDHQLTVEYDSGGGFAAIPTTRMYYGTLCKGTATPDGGAGGDACTLADCSAADCSTVHGLIEDDGDGYYTALYTPAKKGHYTVAASMVEVGGVDAQFYDSTSIGTSAVSAVEGTTIGFSSTATAPTGSGVTNVDGFSVRYEGFVRPEYAQVYTFTVNVDSSDERVKLFVDNELIIDKWTTALTSQTATGTYEFATPNGYYDIKLDYFEAGNNQALSLLYQSTKTGGGTVAQAAIPSTRLYRALDVTGTTYAMEVKPASTCASTSIANGNALSIATAGVLASFSITARDSASNSKTDGGDTFSVSLTGSGGTPLLTGSVTDQLNGKYSISYTPVIAKNYDLFARVGLSDISGSEFTVAVKPNVICGSKTTAAGTGLTSAITNTAAAFALQARDAYANARSQGGDTFIVHVNPSDTTGRSIHGSVTDNSDGQYLCSYTVTASGNYKVYATLVDGAGLAATYFTDAALSTAAYSTSETTVSWTTVAAAAQTAGVPTDGFSVRYTGVVRPEGAVEYTFYVEVDATDERVRLFVDNELLIDKWTTAPTTLESATTQFSTANGYYDIKLEYSDATGTQKLELSYQSSTTTGIEVISSDRLFQTFNAVGAPFTMQTGN